MDGPWTMDHLQQKVPFSLHIVASSSWTMDRTWTMDHESTMRHWMGHGQWTTYDKKSRSASTSWHPRLGPWTEDGAWTMNRPCTMDHEATMNPRNPWKPWIGIHGMHGNYKECQPAIHSISQPTKIGFPKIIFEGIVAKLFCF